MKATGKEVVQMKLVSGDEILCTFSERNEIEETSFIVHSVLQMIPMNDPDLIAETESYILRPYVTYVDNLQKEVSLNPVTVIMVTYPSTAIEAQYYMSLAEIEKQLGYEEPDSTEDDYHARPQSDSGVSNVLSFPSRKQLLTED